MPDDRHEPLSPEGAVRRDAMLAELRERVPAEAARRHRRRAARRVGIALGVVAFAVALWQWGTSVRAPVAPTPAGPIAIAPTAPSDAPSPSAVRIELVATDPGIAERIAVRPTVRAERIGDDELLALLAEQGTPTGLVRTPAGVYLTADIGEPDDAPARESGA
ncbi:MAG: hypothetical protein ACF8QF_06950 [Phycisphaerales bacterium]